MSEVGSLDRPGSRDDLYERDFYAWTRAQVRALEKLAATRPNLELDLPHLIEEVRDLGKSERDAVRSQLRRILVHLLKLRHSRARAPSGLGRHGRRGPRRARRQAVAQPRAPSAAGSRCPLRSRASPSPPRARGPWRGRGRPRVAGTLPLAVRGALGRRLAGAPEVRGRISTAGVSRAPRRPAEASNHDPCRRRLVVADQPAVRLSVVAASVARVRS